VIARIGNIIQQKILFNQDNIATGVMPKIGEERGTTTGSLTTACAETL
jgi:hypothetical protein